MSVGEHIADKLAKLAKLHADGALSDDEFRALKEKLISRVNGSEEQPDGDAIIGLARSDRDIKPQTLNEPALDFVEVYRTQQHHSSNSISETTTANHSMSTGAMPAATHSSRFRVIDWYRAITLTSVPLLIICGILSADQSQSINILAGPTPNEIIGIVAGFVTIVVAYVHFTGSVFDMGEDTLSIPTLLFIRTIRLSEVRDANCVYIVRHFEIPNFALVGGGDGPKTNTATHRIYAVDLSGPFGARQVKFWSRKRRDQFLSILRELCPDCRITRWAAGYGEY